MTSIIIECLGYFAFGCCTGLVGLFLGGWLTRYDFNQLERERLTEIRDKQAYIRRLKEERRRLLEEGRIRRGL